MAFLALILVAFLQIHVGGPTLVPNPQYPIRVRILERNLSRRNGWNNMWGRANIVTPKRQGFDYQSDCGAVFMVNHGAELYSARWKKPDRELEILVSRMGTGKSDKCTLKADLKNFVYVVRNRQISTVPMQP